MLTNLGQPLLCRPFVSKWQFLLWIFIYGAPKGPTQTKKGKCKQKRTHHQTKKENKNKQSITKQKRKHFKVVYMYLQISNFRQISIFSFKVMIQMESLKLKQNSLKKIKYWQRKGGFKVWLEVKITCLIDMSSAVF